MGAPRNDIDPLAVMDMVQKGMTTAQIAEALGANRATLDKKIQALREEQGVIIEFRTVRHLKLTKLQADILDAITPEKIQAASLRDLCLAYKTLADKEADLTGEGETKVKGLLSYLLRLEEQDVNQLESIDAEVVVVSQPALEAATDGEERLPNLR